MLGFFLAVWVVAYWSYAKHNGLASGLVVLARAGLPAAAAVVGAADLLDPSSATFLHMHLLGVSSGLGAFSVLWACAPPSSTSRAPSSCAMPAGASGARGG